MRNFSDKRCKENRNTHFVFSSVFFLNRAVYEIIWKNMVQPGRPQMTMRRMPLPCWITKATNTHSGYVILTAFPLQQWLHVVSLVKPRWTVHTSQYEMGLQVKQIMFRPSKSL